MAIIIDGLDVLSKKIKLPVEAFFIDTNMIIYFADPLQLSGYKNTQFNKINEKSTELIYFLKSIAKSFSTISVAMEYYNYLQRGLYFEFSSEKKDKFNTEYFKKIREEDLTFINIWEKNLVKFKKLFNKSFKIVDCGGTGLNILENFNGNNVDFGDHLLFSTMMEQEENYRYILTNDSDFYSFEGSFNLVTLNKKIIQRAKEEGKLYK